MKPALLAPAYCCLYPKLAEVAREHGYALAIHGTMARDLDLIAIPWTDSVCCAEQLVSAIVEACSGHQPTAGRFDGEKWHSVDMSKPASHPHGRLVWTILLQGGAFIDLGVMPTKFKDVSATASAAPKKHDWSMGPPDVPGANRPMQS